MPIGGITIVYNVHTCTYISHKGSHNCCKMFLLINHYTGNSSTNAIAEVLVIIQNLHEYALNVTKCSIVQLSVEAVYIEKL